MATYRKKSPTADPAKSMLDMFFKGLWWLVSYPFRDKNKEIARERKRQEFRNHWVAINEQFTAGQVKEAIMQADILLDKALQVSGVNGMTLGERLKATTQLPKSILDIAWDAHKVRNRLAHELHYQLSDSEAKQTISGFEQVIRELGLL